MRYTQVIENGKWNGKTHCLYEMLDKPLHWRKPCKIFVDSMGDLFHKSVPFEFLDRIMQTVSCYPQQHIYQVLTKRPERMKEYFEQLYRGLVIFHKGKDFQWPFKNLWLGVSVENNATKHRMDILRQIPAALRFVSFEPLLEDLGELNLDGIGWVIVGCESGPKRRLFRMSWLQKIYNQCKAVNKPCFVKQLPSKKGKIIKNSKCIEFAGWPQQFPKGE